MIINKTINRRTKMETKTKTAMEVALVEGVHPLFE